MSVNEAVAALLLLSSSFTFSPHTFRKLSQPQIYNDSDEENSEPHPISRKTNAKRHLSPVQCENRKQRRLNDSLKCGKISPENAKFQQSRIATTPTSSINRLLPAANFFRPITPQPIFYDNNYEHNYAASDREEENILAQHIDSPQETLVSVSPTFSEMSQSTISLIDDTRDHYLDNPIVQQWQEGEMSSGLVDDVKIEFGKIVRDSKFAKDEYTSGQIEATPIEFGKFVTN
jgi:hypothetical protein